MLNKEIKTQALLKKLQTNLKPASFSPLVYVAKTIIIQDLIKNVSTNWKNFQDFF